LIQVTDQIMGSGKTSYIKQLLNDNIIKKVVSKYLVATLYLDQIDDILKSVPNAIAPERTSKTKSENFITLLKRETDIIVCTHELLKSFSAYELLKPYTLIIDESPDVIEVMYDDGQQDNSKTIAVEDIEILKKAGHVRETEDRFLEWVADEYQGTVYTDIYKYLKNKSLAIRGNRVYKLLPKQLFCSAKEVHIFTYLFESQNMYYYCRYFDLPFQYKHISYENDRYCIKDGKCIDRDKVFPITIYEGNLNDIGNKGLSVNWYKKKATKEDLEKVGKAIYNYLHNDRKAKVGEIIWTTFKQYADGIANKNDKLKLNKKTKSGKVSKGNFVSCTMRATNDYKEATVVVYAVNRFQKPEIIRFFEENQGIVYNEDLFALSEMIQFIWRSAIRDGNPIHIYIPSKRMRRMFQEWLEQLK